LHFTARTAQKVKANVGFEMNKGTRHALWWMLGPLCIWFLFGALESHLLHCGFLNKRDLGFVGGENGTPYEYLTNVWHWDATFGIMGLVAAISFFAGLRMLWDDAKKRRGKTNQKVEHISDSASAV
jgi:hypothetical protein